MAITPQILRQVLEHNGRRLPYYRPDSWVWAGSFSLQTIVTLVVFSALPLWFLAMKLHRSLLRSLRRTYDKVALKDVEIAGGYLILTLAWLVHNFTIQLSLLCRISKEDADHAVSVVFMTIALYFGWFTIAMSIATSMAEYRRRLCWRPTLQRWDGLETGTHDFVPLSPFELLHLETDPVPPTRERRRRIYIGWCIALIAWYAGRLLTDPIHGLLASAQGSGFIVWMLYTISIGSVSSVAIWTVLIRTGSELTYHFTRWPRFATKAPARKEKCQHQDCDLRKCLGLPRVIYAPV